MTLSRFLKFLGNQYGFSVVENLVSISLLGIVIASTSGLIIQSMHANNAARNYNSMMMDIQSIVDQYRSGDFGDLLDKLDTDHSAITNGQTASESTSSAESRATYNVTYSAIRSSPTGPPEAVKITVVATQRRAKFNNANFTYETIIAKVS